MQVVQVIISQNDLHDRQDLQDLQDFLITSLILLNLNRILK